MPKPRTSASPAKPVAGRQVEYRDARVSGLALRVSSGGKKTWTLRYRTVKGLQRRLTIGRYPALSVADAREAAWTALAAASRGGDPAGDRKAGKTAARARKVVTVGDLIERYFEDAARGQHRPNARPKRLSTLTMERDYFERLIRSRFGQASIVDLSRSDIQRFLNEVAAASEGGARHCRNLIRQAFNYAIRQEITERNPAQLVTLARPQSRDRVLTDEELTAIWRLTGDRANALGLHLSRATGLAIRLAMVTLQRGGEVTAIHAREIDRQGLLWVIPGERTKNHRTHAVPLSPTAMEILGEAFSLAGCEAEKWQGFAFPSFLKARPMTRHALSRAMNRVVKALNILNATPHDFRRTGATNITSERIGMPRFIVSRVLNQLSDTGGAAAVTGIYDRNEYLPDKRRALNAWASLLSEIVGITERPSNVLALAR